MGGGSVDKAEATASKGERTRQSLLDAAIRRFAAEGFQRTSVTDIARDVGITAAAVYAHFPGKEALFVAAVDADAEALVALARHAIFDDAEPDVLLTGFLTRLTADLLGAVDHHPLVARVFAGGEPMPAASILQLSSLATLRQELTGLFEAGQSLGLVRPDVDVAAMAMGFEAIVLNQLAHVVATGDPADDERWQAVVAVMEAALRPTGHGPL